MDCRVIPVEEILSLDLDKPIPRCRLTACVFCHLRLCRQTDIPQQKRALTQFDGDRVFPLLQLDSKRLCVSVCRILHILVLPVIHLVRHTDHFISIAVIHLIRLRCPPALQLLLAHLIKRIFPVHHDARLHRQNGLAVCQIVKIHVIDCRLRHIDLELHLSLRRNGDRAVAIAARVPVLVCQTAIP